jgi:CBS domain-containing protein
MPTPERDSQRELLSLVTARVRDAYIRRPFYVDGSLDLVSVCRLLAAENLTYALVRDGSGADARIGIFTTTDLRDAMLRPTAPAVTPVREVARFALVEVGPDTELFEALWLMLRERVHRLVVRNGSEVLGVLGQLDLVSFVANHAHIDALQIDEADSIAALRPSAARVEALVTLMHDSGIRVERIARLAGELNRRLIARAWQLIAPAELVANSCLLVMGSEGRGEQLLRTDQDNALLLRDGYAPPELADVAARFSAALGEFGYPPCPGGIMVTNPRWRTSVSQFRTTLRDWIFGADPEGPMQLAIFLDAAVVAGDPDLLAAARSEVERSLIGNDAFLARFAAPADQFEEPSWWTRLTARADEQAFDIKRLGTFPIVHGVRALCLRHGVRAVGTAQRLARLVELGQLDAPLARDLTESLHYLMGLRLRRQLQCRAAGMPVDNQVVAAALSTMERDQLKDALAITRRFRALLRERFRLDAVQ